MGSDDLCPDCGAKPPANTRAGLCPQCLLRLGMAANYSNGAVDQVDQQRSSALNGAAHHGKTRAVPRASADLPASGVLMTLDQSIGPVPRVLLRDDSGDVQIVHPRSP